MKTFATFCSVFILGTAYCQTYVNPFLDNKNTFNQKDIILLRNSPGSNNVVHQIQAFDWLAHDAGQTNNIFTPLAPEGAVETVTLGSNRYMVAIAGRFNDDHKDDMFYLMRTSTGWQCALNDLDVTFDESDSTYEHTLESPENYITIPASGTGFPKVTVGDLDGDGTDEVAVAWWEPLDDRVHIQVLDADNSSQLQLRAATDDRSSFRVNGFDAYDLGSGDLNGDGSDELILTGLEPSGSGDAEYQVFVQLYEVGGPGSSTITPRAVSVLNDENIAGAGNNEELAYVQTAVSGLLTRPDTMPDTSRDIFAAFEFTRYGEQGAYTNFFQYVLRATADLNTLSLVDEASETIGGGSTFLDNFPLEIGTGDLNGDRIEDVAMLSRDGVRMFTVNEDLIEPKGTSGPGVTGEGSYGMNEAVDRMEIGDVDMDGRDEIVLFTHYQDMEPPNEHTFTLTVMGRDPDFGIDPPVQVTYFEDFDGSSTRAHAIALGNLDGRDMRLGDPMIKDCEFVQPVFIIGAIPTHFDVIGGVQLDVNNCYPVQDCDQSVNITQTGSTSTQATASFTGDWAITSELEAGASAGLSKVVEGGFNVGTTLSAKVGHKFEYVNTESTTQTITISINATADDMVQYLRFPVTLYQYPVLDSVDDTLTWVLAAFPANDLSPQTIIANGKSVFNYTPEHEVGNLLSYPPINNNYGQQIGFPTAAGNWTILPPGNLPDYTMSPSGGVVYTLTNSNGLAWSNSNNNYESVNTGISPMGFGVGLPTPNDFGYMDHNELIPGWEPNAYEASLLTLYANEIDQETEFVITTANIIGSPNEFNYVVRPKIYWNTDGAGSVAFDLDMDASQGGGSYWSQAYTTAPDPALNLPYRYEQVINPDLSNTANLLRTKSMRFSKLLPQIGDTFSIYLRVYNYSFMSTSAPVEFSLYIGDPATGGTLITDAEGNTLFATSTALGARGREEVEVRVVANESMLTGEFVKFYAMIDPNNEVDEIHEGNNLGWAQFGYDCNQPGMIVSVPEIGQHGGPEDLLHIHPVPGNDQVIIEHDLRGLRSVHAFVLVRNMIGEEVARFSISTVYAGQIFWNTRSIPAGMYAIGLYDEHGLRSSGKAIITH